MPSMTALDYRQSLGAEREEMAVPLRAATDASALVGVIDIGSNSIRLVIYRGGGKLPHPQFNEREVCRLAEGVAATGCLDKKRIAHALQVLRRFARLNALSRVSQLHVFATEAVRRANNASHFISQAEAILATEIEVISGIAEACLSAQGVAGGFIAPKGVVADLGGELRRLAARTKALAGALRCLGE